MKEIPLTRGLVAMVDDEDHGRVSRLSWHAVPGHNKWYAAAAGNGSPGEPSTIYMHRFVIDAPTGIKVDHKSGDGLDNTRANLRLASDFQNSSNVFTHRDNKSGFKGVCLHNASGRWMAEVMHMGRKHYLGLHDSPEEAAIAYDCAARELFGEFKKLNFPGMDKYPTSADKLLSGVVTSSRFRRVSWDSGAKRWAARISIGGKEIRLGRFRNEIDAAKAYNEAALAAFGDEAKLNVIPPDSD